MRLQSLPCRVQRQPCGLQIATLLYAGRVYHGQSGCPWDAVELACRGARVDSCFALVEYSEPRSEYRA